MRGYITKSVLKAEYFRIKLLTEFTVEPLVFHKLCCEQNQNMNIQITPPRTLS